MSGATILRIPHPKPNSNDEREPLLVDVQEAARLLSISPRSVWQLTKDQKLRAKRVGRRVLYSRAELERFANG
jgi:excisionase family DNA binding protein